MFDDFDTQVHPEEMGFPLFTPAELAEFEADQNARDEIDQKGLEAMEEFLHNSRPRA